MEQFLPEGRLFSTQRNRALLRTPEGLRQAMEEQIILEAAPDKCDAAHALHFRLPGREVVMPREECAVGLEDSSTREVAVLSRVGRPTCFVVEGLPGEDGAVVPRISRKAAQERCLRWLMALPAGTVLPATVTRLERFGAFVDVGCGVPSLVPLDAISVSHISHPGCRFRVGEEIYVVVRETLPEQNRLLLSHRELMGTWAENAAHFAAGEVVTGTVRGVLDYGVFVELAPNLPALAEYRAGVEVGDRVSVYIKSIQTEKEKIKLLILDRLPRREGPVPPVYFQTQGRVTGWRFRQRERNGRTADAAQPEG
ncbi:MAG: S1 RNA-binding domain-containing protein [Clostridiales bacterium]|nr:S1 RNA-binding domain-containing protein [Clostridiales bacterium]